MPLYVGFSQRALSSSSAWAQADLNDDFKTKFADSKVDVTKQIEDDINGTKVFVYMKVSAAASQPGNTRSGHIIITLQSMSYLQGDPEAPMCGFSNMVCKILHAYGEHLLAAGFRPAIQACLMRSSTSLHLLRSGVQE